MTIEQRTSGGVIILDVRGRLTTEALRDTPLIETVRPLLQGGHKQILLNLGGVPYVDTMGLCNIVETYVATKRQGGALKLLGLTPHVREPLRVTRLLTVFETYESEAEGLASFGPGAPVI